MQIRTITTEEMREATYLSAQAFGRGARDPEGKRQWWEEPDREEYTAYGVWDEEGLQTKVVVIHFQQQFGPDVVLPMGGIADVACLPAARGKGYAGACLKRSLEGMRENGQVVSTLFPFSWEYYRRLGWEWVGVNRRYTVKTRILQPDPGTEKVRVATQADRPSIRALYNDVAKRYRGMLVREKNRWNRLLNDSDSQYTYTYLYENAGRVEGYLTHRGNRREETGLDEFLTTTPAAQRALLGLLRRHEMQIEKFTWDGPADDSLWFVGYHWDLTTQIGPWTMGRVVDVVQALRAWKPASSEQGSVILGVQDAC